MKAIAIKTIESLLLVLAVIVFNFMLLYFAPGDAIDALSGDGRAETIEALRKQFGLDQPFHVRLWNYLTNVLQGDFGLSTYENRPAIETVIPRIGPTLLLVLSALALAVLLGTTIGTIAARKPHSRFSAVITVLALIGFSMPVFWTGLLLLLVFGVNLGWFPISGMVNLRLPSDASVFVQAVDILHHLFLPMVSLALIYLASYVRLSRASMLEVLQSDYIRTARAKGLSERTVLFKHALRNGVIPIITVVGMEFGVIMSGAILVETVYAWPGLGRLTFNAVLTRDTNVLLAILTISSITVIIANLLTDIVYRLVDPRIRISGGP